MTNSVSGMAVILEMATNLYIEAEIVVLVNSTIVFLPNFTLASLGVSTQKQSSGFVAHENSAFRNLALAVSGRFMA